MSFLFAIIYLVSSFYQTYAFTFLGNLKLPVIHTVDQLVKASRFGDKRLVVITGTSSGMGRKTCRQLVESGGYFVIGAVRDMEKMAIIQEEDQLPADSFQAMEVEVYIHLPFY
jgi:NADPH-dependent curcumin reductase CurA